MPFHITPIPADPAQTTGQMQPEQYDLVVCSTLGERKSRKFHQDVLGMCVVGDFGANIQLENGLFLQTKETWEDIIAKKAIKFEHNAGELYF